MINKENKNGLLALSKYEKTAKIAREAWEMVKYRATVENLLYISEYAKTDKYKEKDEKDD